MKRMLYIALGIVVGVAASFVSVASATGMWSHHTYGIWCKSAITAQYQTAILCIPENNKGYGIGISTKAVIVVNVATGKRVFARYQP